MGAQPPRQKTPPLRSVRKALPLGLSGAMRHASGGTCAEPVEVGQDRLLRGSSLW